MTNIKFLQPGDLLIAISPSGTLRELTNFERGIEIWKSRGYRVELSPGFDSRWGYLAGSDENRIRQLADALNDPDCRGILCVRGGFGSTRLLEKGKVAEAKNAPFPMPDSLFPMPDAHFPKWLIGFSDITALLWNHAKLGIWGVHGPLLTTLAAEPDWSVDRLFDCIEGRRLPPLSGKGWGGGKATGRLLPANLTVATHLLGTPYLPDLTGVILAFEDVSEAPYRVDRMLTTWRMAGAFVGVRGIALGRFSRCEVDPKIPSFSIEEVLRDRLFDLNIPIVSDLPFGHDGVNAALPVGIMATLDADSGLLICDE
ncbi:MAG: LD-carboxypeptidase [Tychonema bourrellyi B0820]|uniref:LD-carboxypeptidase n=1 Tax=Tychonema bourrellyi FEM_GT703 TaxID=2040638 RepID=A0A2G4EYK6_9CYAN|nr:LD-carboxypeptidase [Tychonema bourrellyi]MDQ2097441.1 LD-carboxypeptidase [Tychonema bourrellyi B0820]PHX54609.1 LD-carboxypeptidase [Tychonema bourrellyi FEM_GT703]